jgi:hypothetical protein
MGVEFLVWEWFQGQFGCSPKHDLVGRSLRWGVYPMATFKELSNLSWLGGPHGDR